MVYMELPLAPVERILKQTNMRIGDDAVKEFANLLEEVVSDIAAESVTIAKMHHRKTVIEDDVRKAVKKIL